MGVSVTASNPVATKYLKLFVEEGRLRAVDRKTAASMHRVPRGSKGLIPQTSLKS